MKLKMKLKNKKENKKITKLKEELLLSEKSLESVRKKNTKLRRENKRITRNFEWKEEELASSKEENKKLSDIIFKVEIQEVITKDLILNLLEGCSFIEGNQVAIKDYNYNETTEMKTLTEGFNPYQIKTQSKTLYTDQSIFETVKFIQENPNEIATEIKEWKEKWGYRYGHYNFNLGWKN